MCFCVFLLLFCVKKEIIYIFYFHKIPRRQLQIEHCKQKHELSVLIVLRVGDKSLEWLHPKSFFFCC